MVWVDQQGVQELVPRVPYREQQGLGQQLEQGLGQMTTIDGRDRGRGRGRGKGTESGEAVEGPSHCQKTRVVGGRDATSEHGGGG